MDFAAEDHKSINEVIEREAGFRAGLRRANRDAPKDCKNTAAWYAGHTEGFGLAPPVEAAV